MKNIFKICYIGAATLMFASSCAPEHDDFEIKNSTANFSKFISIGNSLTAGFADGGLYLEGQKVAFPNLIAEQMKQVGGGTFTSPFFDENQSNGSGYLRLAGFIGPEQPDLQPVTNNLAVRGANSHGSPLYTKYTGGEITNYGVPLMRLDMAFAPGIGTSLGNPFFERLLPDTEPASTTYFGYTTTKSHTFFSFWLGSNDVLGYASNGAVNKKDNGEEDPTKALTSVDQFTALYNNYINALTANGQKGIVANIPDITTIAFFTTVTYDRIVQGIAQKQQIPVANVPAIIIQTKQGPRPATAEDLFVLTFNTSTLGKENNLNIPYGFHPLNPIEDKFVLDKSEVAEVQARVTAFNNVIKQVAESKDLALADVYGFLNKVKNGYVYNGVGISSKFISGNAFSLDGVHLTPMGNAITGNIFIDAINKKYNASIPKIDVSKYPGVKMPN